MPNIIEKKDFTSRTFNVLHKNGILSYEDLCGKTVMEILEITGLGRKTFRQVREFLKSKNMYLKNDGEIQKLCLFCQKLFFSEKFRNQQFCNGSCRARYYHIESRNKKIQSSDLP